MESLSKEARRLIGRRILLVLCLGNFLSFLDRVNVSYAALEMNRELGLTAQVFGFGAGVFFIAYAGFQVPSSYFMVRMGGPKWFGRIMISWGICSGAMAFISGHWSFYALRFLLGVCEAGFVPGASYYLARWYPKAELGRVYSRWILSAIFGSILAGPFAALLLKANAFGFSGWRWMFFAEAAPAIALGCYILVRLPESPASATWLKPRDQAILRETIEFSRLKGTALHSFWKALVSPRVWLYAACFCLYPGYGFILWLPQVVKSLFAGSSSATISMVSTIPWVCAAAGTLLLGWSSDRLGERRWHIALTAFWVGLCLIIGVSTTGLTSLVMLCMVGFGLNAFIALFNAVPTGELTGVGAATGLAIINAAGGVGGFAQPYVFGLLRGWTGSFYYGMLFLGCMAIVVGLIPILFPRAFPSCRVTPPNLQVIDPSLEPPKDIVAQLSLRASGSPGHRDA